MSGRLVVTLKALESTPEDIDFSVAVQVLDPDDLGILRSATSGEEIDLEPGTYVVAVTLPDGSQHVTTRDIQEGAREDLSVDWRPARFGKVTARAVSRAGVRAASSEAPRRFALRFVDPRGTMLEVPPAAHVVDAERKNGVLQVSMRIELRGNEEALRFAQLSLEGHVPVFVALPLAPYSSASECRLDVALSARHVDPAVHLGGSPDAETVAHFVVGRTLERIAAVPDLARNMLISKRRHPLGAALGGYALLRLRADEQMQQWPSNLAKWFEWLPDGPIIVGEQARRRHDLNAALGSFTNAVRRGPPVFTDGVSILTSRLREFVRGKGIKGASPEMSEKAVGLLESIMAWAPYVDLTSLAYTVTGADLADLGASQCALADHPAGDGWRVWSMPFGGDDDWDANWSEEE